MAKKWQVDEDDIPPGNGWEETRDLHPEDVFLRSHGYRIEHRRKNEAAVWSLAGKQYTEGEALERCGYREPGARDNPGASREDLTILGAPVKWLT
jgi:hypothetical protein